MATPISSPPGARLDDEPVVPNLKALGSILRAQSRLRKHPSFRRKVYQNLLILFVLVRVHLFFLCFYGSVLLLAFVLLVGLSLLLVGLLCCHTHFLGLALLSIPILFVSLFRFLVPWWRLVSARNRAQQVSFIIFPFEPIYMRVL